MLYLLSTSDASANFVILQLSLHKKQIGHDFSYPVSACIALVLNLIFCSEEMALFQMFEV